MTAWRLAASPINISPSFVNVTIDGVVLCPSAFVITKGLPPSTIAIQQFVVPKSIPIILIISPFVSLLFHNYYNDKDNKCQPNQYLKKDAN